MTRGAWLGPVFAYEWLARSRRWQGYAVRALFVAALLACLGVVWQSATRNTNLTARQQLVAAGTGFYQAMTVTQLALVLLAAPAATAGAICLDKARGTLAHVIVTDLTDSEVVLGKLGARLVPVLNLVACALPVAALGTLLGGIDPVALTATLMISGGVALLGCTAALTLSVWLAKAHEVMLVVFAAWTLWVLALPICSMMSPGFLAPRWAQICNPFWLTLAPYTSPGATSLLEPFVFLLGCVLLSSGLAWLSVARLRPVYLAQSSRVPKPPRGPSRAGRAFRRRLAWLPGPSLDANPVLWREWHKNRPSRWVRGVWILYYALAAVFSVRLIWINLTNPAAGRGEMAMFLNASLGLVGLLLLSASAATTLSEERVRGSLDVLLATPIPTRSIVRGKWWGAFRRAPWLAFWPGLVSLSLVPHSRTGWGPLAAALVPALIIAQAAALASLGLALATWISRVGRAATWTVTALVASVIGWPVLCFLLSAGGPTNTTTIVISQGSPFYNLAMTTLLLDARGGMSNERSGIVIGAIFWTVGYAAIAAGLLMATLATFDRCLGRTPEGLIPGRPGAGDPTRRVGQAVMAPASRIAFIPESEIEAVSHGLSTPER